MQFMTVKVKNKCFTWWRRDGRSRIGGLNWAGFLFDLGLRHDGLGGRRGCLLAKLVGDEEGLRHEEVAPLRTGLGPEVAQLPLLPAVR